LKASETSTFVKIVYRDSRTGIEGESSSLSLFSSRFFQIRSILLLCHSTTLSFIGRIHMLIVDIFFRRPILMTTRLIRVMIAYDSSMGQTSRILLHHTRRLQRV
jgi:hypothetical protein